MMFHSVLLGVQIRQDTGITADLNPPRFWIPGPIWTPSGANPPADMEPPPFADLDPPTKLSF